MSQEQSLLKSQTQLQALCDLVLQASEIRQRIDMRIGERPVRGIAVWGETFGSVVC